MPSKKAAEAPLLTIPPIAVPKAWAAVAVVAVVILAFYIGGLWAGGPAAEQPSPSAVAPTATPTPIATLAPSATPAATPAASPVCKQVAYIEQVPKEVQVPYTAEECENVTSNETVCVTRKVSYVITQENFFVGVGSSGGWAMEPYQEVIVLNNDTVGGDFITYSCFYTLSGDTSKTGCYPRVGNGPPKTTYVEAGAEKTIVFDSGSGDMQDGIQSTELRCYRLIVPETKEICSVINSTAQECQNVTKYKAETHYDNVTKYKEECG